MGNWHGKLHKAAFRKMEARKRKKARFLHHYKMTESEFRSLPKAVRHELRMKKQNPH